MPIARRIPVPLVLAGAVACCGFLTGPATASSTSAATSYGVAPSHVMLNPQPLPPKWTSPLLEVGLNPQPLPPRYFGGF